MNYHSSFNDYIINHQFTGNFSLPFYEFHNMLIV
jgi:hypothetical protein